MNLNGKHALVTGASRGIGAAITELLIQQQCHVTGLSRTQPEIILNPSMFDFSAVDFSQLDELPKHLKQLHQQTGALDVLVCNAGYGRFGSLEEFSTAQIRRLIDVNLTSQILVTREFLPAMKSHPNSHIVLIGSEAALSGGKKGAIYSATKFALRGFAQSLREECAGSGVRVTLMNPGMVKTGFFDDLSFAPGEETDCHLIPLDIATAVIQAIESRSGVCVDEISLSPQKSVIHFGKN